MFLPFRRSRRRAHQKPCAPGCSCPACAQRRWEVQALLSTLHPLVREALFAWLLAPADSRRWPPPDRFNTRRAPISAEEMGDQSRPVAYRLLLDELRVIHYMLDLPPEALSGLTRNGLLTAHAMRLRQLEHWLWPFYAAREIKRMVA